MEICNDIGRLKEESREIIEVREDKSTQQVHLLASGTFKIVEATGLMA